MDKETFRKMNRSVNDMIQRESDIQNGEYYKMALDDLKRNNIDRDLMAYCESRCDFDRRKAAALYVREAAKKYRKTYEPYGEQESSDDWSDDYAASDSYTIRKRERQRALREAEELRKSNDELRRRRLMNARYRDESHKSQTDKNINVNASDSVDEVDSTILEHNKNFRPAQSDQEILEKYLKPWVGAIIFYTIGVIMFSSFGEDLRNLLSISTGIGGWFMFTAARGALVSSYYESKGFAKKPANYLQKMFLVSFFVTVFLLSIPSL
ncbi:MAG: hypothetical protein HLUCCX14_15190 [Marinobacter excellens HL-55]|uniref:Uncharacterized protein n=1 Tax=Marinobacter excellens HL-55 TaxID=1305731 RepID=A0A0P7YB20_9GAMM|nr:MAG: hypothetical protein HLUCCX14_15190 [Marinobacter excellens HL-55]